VSDLFAPISGEVTEANGELGQKPEIVNQDPYGKGWLVKVKMTGDAGLKKLMDAKAYEEALKVLDSGMGEEFAALQADRRGDILLAQGKKPEAKEQYLKAFKAFDEHSDYRRLVLVKLNTLGVDPLAAK